MKGSTTESNEQHTEKIKLNKNDTIESTEAIHSSKIMKMKKFLFWFRQVLQVSNGYTRYFVSLFLWLYKIHKSQFSSVDCCELTIIAANECFITTHDWL